MPLMVDGAGVEVVLLLLLVLLVLVVVVVVSSGAGCWVAVVAVVLACCMRACKPEGVYECTSVNSRVWVVVCIVQHTPLAFFPTEYHLHFFPLLSPILLSYPPTPLFSYLVHFCHLAYLIVCVVSVYSHQV